MMTAAFKQPKFILRIVLAGLLALYIPMLVHADALDDAKIALQVGEQRDGYIGAVSSSASADIRGLISDINAKRRARYSEIADQNNIGLHDVELLAGKRTFELTQPGHMLKTQSGAWQKK
jgi:uncharacterized protein YdbL (DUF1318 family)